jgi:hypothetical protein
MQLVRRGDTTGDAGTEWRCAWRDALAAVQWAAGAMAGWKPVILRDRVTLVAPLFTMHVRELEARAATAAGIGAGTGALLSGVWGAKRREAAAPVGALLPSVFVGAALGASGGFVAGRLYERAHGPLRPRVAATLPLWAEDRLRCSASAHLADDASHADVPAWRVQGWRDTWAGLAAEYMHAASGGIVPPPGAPSLCEVLRRAPQTRAPPIQ